MEKVWYCLIDGKTTGPYDGEQLKKLAAAGLLAPTDQVRRGKEGQFKQASGVKGLFATPPPAAAIEPPVPQDSTPSQDEGLDYDEEDDDADVRIPRRRNRDLAFPALQSVATMLRFFAILTGLGMLVYGIVNAVELKNLLAFLIIMIVSFAIALLQGILLWALSDVIMVLLHIERNTRSR